MCSMHLIPQIGLPFLFVLFLAIKDFQEAINKDNNNRRAKEGIDRAQRLLKNSQKRDYYKILGVKR